MAYRIKPFCLGCHYCALECPTHAIDYQRTQYQIDPDKCVECGRCVEVCNISAIDTGKPETVTPHEPIRLEADAVILGAGAAGVIAAVKLAEKTGIDKEGLLSEVARYNEFCKKGVDEDFGKNPRDLKPIEDGPYYAIFGKMATDGAFGGVLVNPKCEVYRADKSGIIPGFYAAGDNASGVQANAGVPGDHRLKAFTDFQWAANGAYLAAENCAMYLA